jgi:hypothetical protein
VSLSESSGGRSAGFAIKLRQGEWTAYTVQSGETKSYEPVVRVKMESGPASLECSLGEQAQEIALPNGEWVELKLKAIHFSQGANRLRLLASQGTILVDWIWLR